MGANDDREKLQVAAEECGKLERELAAALAVIAEVEAAGYWLATEEAKVGTWWSPPARKGNLRARYINKIDAAVATSPADALEAVKAAAWDEGYWLGINGHTGPGNPYRRGTETPRHIADMSRAYAAEYRKTPERGDAL